MKTKKLRPMELPTSSDGGWYVPGDSIKVVIEALAAASTPLWTAYYCRVCGKKNCTWNHRSTHDR